MKQSICHSQQTLRSLPSPGKQKTSSSTCPCSHITQPRSPAQRPTSVAHLPHHRHHNFPQLHHSHQPLRFHPMRRGGFWGRPRSRRPNLQQHHSSSRIRVGFGRANGISRRHYAMDRVVMSGQFDGSVVEGV